MGHPGGSGGSSLTRVLALAPKPSTPMAARSSWRRLAPDIGAIAAVLIASTLYLVLSRPMWFFGDDWEFLLSRGSVSGNDRGLWAPHQEHWSTGPILIYKAVFALFGLRSYLPYAVPVLLAHAAVALLTYILLVRLETTRWAALAVAVVVAFLGSGAENILWDFQIGFVGSLALGLLGLWFFDCFDRAEWRMWPVWVALVVGLTFSAVGVVMVLYVAVYAVFRRGPRCGALIASVPALIYMLWFISTGRSGFGQGPSAGLSATLAILPGYVWAGLTHAWEGAFGIPGSGAAILLVLLGSLLFLTRGRASQLAWAGAAAAFAQLVLAGFGRAAMGVDQATSSRYTYLIVVMMAPSVAVVVAEALDRLPEPRRLTAAFGVGLLALVALNGVHEALAFRAIRTTDNAAMRDRVLASVQLADQGYRILNPYPDATFNPDITVTALLSEGIRAALPDAQPSEQGLLDAQANLQVLLTTEDIPATAPSAISLGAGFRGAAAAVPGCQTFQTDGPNPTLQVFPGAGGSRISLTTQGTEVTTVLRRGGLTSDGVLWTVRPGIPQNVVSSVADAAVEIGLATGGQVTVCW